MRILVIEDHKGLREELCGWLTEHGHEALLAKDEQTAENILHDQGVSVSIALVDMHLPPKEEGLEYRESGLRLIRLMTDKYPRVVSVVFTGNADLHSAASCMEAGAFSYLEKGDDSNLDLLRSVIERAEERWKHREFVHRMSEVTGLPPSRADAYSESLNSFHDHMEEMQAVFRRIRDEVGAFQLNLPCYGHWREPAHGPKRRESSMTSAADLGRGSLCLCHSGREDERHAYSCH